MSYLLLRANAKRSIPLKSKSVQCVVTSGPYFGLRDYGDDQQIGLEETPEKFVAAYVNVFREVWRVLRDDGVAFVNIGTTYTSSIIESDEYIIRDDLTNEEYVDACRWIAEALSPLRITNAPPEQEVQSVLGDTTRETTQLSRQSVQEVQQAVPGPQTSSGTGARDLLLPIVCKIGEPNKEAVEGSGCMLGMREKVRKTPIRNQEESRQAPLLQSGMLVQLQHERESSSLDRRSGRENEPRRCEVEEGSPETRQEILPTLSREREVGSAPHSAIREIPGNSVGGVERRDPLPLMSRTIPKSRDGLHKRVHNDRISSNNRVELTLRKNDIPSSAIHYFRPRWKLGAKSNLCIPHRLVLALQADGWTLRDEIVWYKPSPMPESVTDRTTKAHEMVFMLTKSHRYYYDQEGIKEPAVGGSKGSRFDQGKTARHQLSRSSTLDRDDHETRNLRSVWDIDEDEFAQFLRWKEEHENRDNAHSVWDINTFSFPGAHFATMPPELAKRCIKAGTSEKGCCPECGKSWARIIEKDRAATRPGNISKVHSQTSVHPESSYHEHAGMICGNRDPKRHTTVTQTVGWEQACDCPPAEPVPSLVFDPFNGSGTTGSVADGLGRDYVGMDLNLEYLTMAAKRISRPHASLRPDAGKPMPLFGLVD